MANAETFWDTWLNIQQGNPTSNSRNFSNGLGEKPCLGYGGCTGKGIASGYGRYYGLAEYGSTNYETPYRIESFNGYWSVDDDRMPYDNSSRNYNQKYDYFQQNWFNQFSASPSSSRK